MIEPAPQPDVTPSPSPKPPETIRPIDLGPTNIGGLFRDPLAAAAQQERAWRATREADAATLRRISDWPQAVWLRGRDDLTTVKSSLDRAQGARVVVTVDAIPGRGCIPYRFTSAERLGYPELITDLTGLIGDRPAILILEPRGVAQQACQTAALASDRAALLSKAVEQFQRLPSLAVYLDAGANALDPANLAATYLLDAGGRLADGFSVNVGGYGSDTEEIAYGRSISSKLGGKPFVIDTGRNGNGPATDGASCNPAGRSLGRTPTLATNVSDVDAFLWVKPPGESDGECRGFGPVPSWEADLALELARNAAG